MPRHQGGEDYLRQYPDLQRWMNRCAACGQLGYKPELPENIYPRANIAAATLRRYFRPLVVSEFGICEVCREAMAGSKLFETREAEGHQNG